MFAKSSAFYDAIYAAAGKDYAREGQQIHAIIREHKRSPGNRLLDVACGTGAHLAQLHTAYEVEGLDIDPRMLEIARARCPGVTFHLGNMVNFDLGRQYDAVICMFSSIGYAKTVPRLRKALRAMSTHVLPGGVLIIEPWLKPETFQPGHIGAVFVDQPELKVARVNDSALKDSLSVMKFHYLVATPKGIEHFTEVHKLGLYSHEDYLAAYRRSGLEVVYDPEGPMGRGLYVGLKPTRRVP
jgi:SAM-dependent methyltransferase